MNHTNYIMYSGAICIMCSVWNVSTVCKSHVILHFVYLPHMIRHMEVII